MKDISIKAALKDEVKKVSAKSGFEVIHLDFSVGTMLSSEHFEYDTRAGVIKWGKNNLLPDYLVKVAKLESTKHSAIIRRKVKMIAGQGWQEPETDEARNFLANIYGNKSMNKIARLNQFDRVVLEQFALGIRWNNDKTRIAAIDYISMRKVRATPKFGIWKVSDDWSAPKSKGSNTQIKQQLNSEKLPDGFNEMEDKEKKFYLNQIYVFQGVDSSGETYPSPEYASGMNWILSDSGVATFTLNMIKKNFTGGYHINISTGIPEDDERKDFKKAFKKEYAGELGESILITFSEPDSKNTPELKALPSTGNEDIYEKTEKRASENIFIAHEVTDPQLFAIRVPGELGGKNNLQESLEMFQSVYISPQQKEYEEVINSIAKINGIEEELKLELFSLESIDKSNPAASKLLKRIGRLPSELRTAVIERLTDNQILSMVGIEPESEILSEGDKLREKMSSLSPLLATKVFERLSEEQVLSIVGVESKQQNQ